MAIRKLGTLTLDKLHEIGAYVGSTEGTMLIARYRNSIAAGEVPNIEDLKKIADALEPLAFLYGKNKGRTENVLRDALAEFAKGLGLLKRQGRQQQSEFELTGKAIPVVKYIMRTRELIDSGMEISSAKMKARNEGAAQIGIGDRAMRNRIKKYEGHSYKILAQIEDAEKWKSIVEDNASNNFQG